MPSSFELLDLQEHSDLSTAYLVFFSLSAELGKGHEAVNKSPLDGELVTG